MKEKKQVYDLLAKIYVKGREKNKPLTQRELLWLAEEVYECNFYERPLRKRIKELKLK